ncbi:MAG TPA: hypothetical protein VM802_10265 [Chitinophaga sp.]|nr:hypothetical protein [Chitinophaga sp.]HVI45247.1 hypothetical protein [Chitinophaga sp.]
MLKTTGCCSGIYRLSNSKELNTVFFEKISRQLNSLSTGSTEPAGGIYKNMTYGPLFGFDIGEHSIKLFTPICLG